MALARRAMRRSTPLLILIAVIAGTFAFAGCNSTGDDVSAPPTRTPGTGTPRSFEMGLSSVPTDPSDQSYRNAFRFAGNSADVVLIQRAPPWSEFVPGGAISDRTRELTRAERDMAKAAGLKVFIAIDPTDPNDRGKLAALPDDLRGRDFSDSQVRSAFIAYAKYMAVNYKPAYMALGVEVDLYYRRRDDAAFRTFQSLYFEAYNAVKEASPSTLVFPTFQYEDLLGKLNTGEDNTPLWPLINRFEPKLDMLAISTFPGFVFGSAGGIPTDYYTQMRAQSAKPIAFVSVGWSSATPPQDAATPAALNDTGQNEQSAFLALALADAQKVGARLFVWYLARDPTVQPNAGFGPLAQAGLYAADGKPKLAWTTWQVYVNRPIEPAQP